jgi:hypothetical protein
MAVREQKNSINVVSIESLEGRQFLSGEAWVPAARLIKQDVAAQNFANITGAGYTVAVIDSGVDYNHPSLGGGMGKKVVAGWDFQNNDSNPMNDSNAHGTGVAGVLAADPYVYKGLYNRGIAPAAKIVALKENNTYGVKSALEWVLANRTKYNIVAVNMTDWGGASGLIYKDTLAKLVAAGVFVSHPSGNGGAGAGVGPALTAGDFSAGSVTLSGSISSFTQRGPELDMLAPGDNVTLPYYDVGSKKHIYVDTADGTSWSSPAIVGAAVLIKQINPSFNPLQIMSILQDSGVGVYDGATRRTYKRLDLNAALTLAYQRSGKALPAPVTNPQPTPVTPPAGNGPQAVQSPFATNKITNGSVLQAEDFDYGGENVAYHDVDGQKGTSSYRKSEGVDVDDISGGRQVSMTKAGEWLEYTVNVPTAGTFNINTRLAAQGTGAQFHIEVDGVNKSGALNVPNTGKWTTFTNVTKTGVALSAGNHVLRLKFDRNGSTGYVANVDYLQFTTTGLTGPAPTPAATLPTINATSLAGQHGVTTNGVIGSLDQGDWVMYKNVNFGSTGATQFLANVASNKSGGKIEIRLDSGTGPLLGTLTVSSTGSYTNFKQQSTAIKKTTGTHTVFLTFIGSGVANVQWFKLA